MPTKKPRLNITLDTLLTLLAKQRHQSIASLAKELIFDALERCEDMALSKLSDIRIKQAEKAKYKMISHKDAWR